MNPKLKRLIHEVAKLTREIRNLKSRITRRQKKLTKTLDPLERGRVEAEIEVLRKRVTALRVEEVKCNISIIGTVARLDGKIPEIDEVDWEKAGRA